MTDNYHFNQKNSSLEKNKVDWRNNSIGVEIDL